MRIHPIWMFILSISLLTSCEGDISITYHFTDLGVMHCTSKGGTPQIMQDDTIPAEVYALQLNLFPEVISRSKGRYIDYDEAPPRAMNPMIKLEITSESNFDDTHPAGSMLNEYFLYYPGSFAHTEELHGTEPFNITQVYLPEFPRMYLPEYAQLLLMTPPTNPGPHIFHVKVTWSTTNTSEATTYPIVLN